MTPLELPEIETYRRDLERDVIGRKVKSVELLNLKSFPDVQAKKEFTAKLEGAKVADVERVGLHLVLRLNNDYAFVARLGEFGRLLRTASKDTRSAETIGVVTFGQGGDLRLEDSEGSSAFQVVPEDDLSDYLPLAEEMGIDLQAKPVSWVEFGRALRSQSAPLKLLISDPTLFVGIGDIYSNEILFDSGLRHDRMSGELSTQEIRRLNRSAAGVLHEAVKNGGTSLPDRPFFQLSGEEGEYASQLTVYGKAGSLSPRSREPIQKTRFKHQVVYFCKTQV